jgi:hypothetical protein
MTSRILIIRAFANSASRLAVAANPPSTLTKFLQAMQDAIFQNEIQDGKILISTSEAGGAVAFQIPQGQTPTDVLALVQEALDWCNQYPDPDHPPLTARRIKRLRASFAKATI